MGTPNRHIKYRKSVYRRNRIKLIALTTTVSIVLVSIIFLIVGNILGDKVEHSTDSTDSQSTPADANEHMSVPSVYAYPVPLSEDGSTLQGRISKAKGNGFSSACFYLDSADGSLMYSSPTAQRLGKQQASADLRTLSNAVPLFADSGFYTVGITHVPDLDNDDDLARAAAIGYHSALIAEAMRAGVDEVLIYVDKLPWERYTELIRMCEEARRLCPDKGAIGISLPPSFFAQENAEASFEALWQVFDTVAIDLSDPPEESTLTEHTEASLSNILYYLLRYNIRVLLPSSDATYADAVSMINAKGSQNILLLP